jgi:hypothetical protein
MENNTPEQKPEMITAFESKIHGSIITDASIGNVLALIEAELENLESDEFEVLKIEVRMKKMTKKAYDNLPEFEGY